MIILNKLPYIGTKKGILKTLKETANELLAEIEECNLSKEDTEYLMKYKSEIKDINQIEDIENLITDIDSDKRFYLKRNEEVQLEYRGYPEDDYSDGVYNKV